MSIQRYLNILVVEPNKLPYEKKIKNNLKSRQDIVKGNIEYIYMKNCDDAILVCNEEGKLLDLPFNRCVGNDIIAGTFFIVGDSIDNGEDRSLTKEQIEKYKEKFNEKSICETKKIIEEKSNELFDFF